MKLDWCGYEWNTTMSGGRRIHPEQPWEWYCDDCVSIDEEGIMHLKTIDKPAEIKHWDGKTYHPTKASGTVSTEIGFDYGEFSCKLKMPKGKNISASFWLSGVDSWPPEIDIEEGWPENGNWFHWTSEWFPWLYPSWRTTNNVVYLDKKGDEKSRRYAKSKNISWFLQPKDPSDNWVEYSCIWTPDDIRFFADGKQTRKISNKIARKLIENNTVDSHTMRAIINIWSGNPDIQDVRMDTEFLAKDFKYTRL